MDSQCLQKYGILEWDEYTMLIRERASVNQKITEKVITKRELLSHFYVELKLFKLCQLKIKEVLDNTHEVLDTQTLVFLFNQVFILFRNMHVSFSIDDEMLTLYINFCQDNVSYLNADQLDILKDIIMQEQNNQNNWIHLINLHLNLKSLDHDKVEHLLKEATKGAEGFYNEKLSLKMRPKYLEWCIEFKNIDATRNIFNELKELKPPCPKLYLVMIAIERQEPNYKLDTIRKLYKEVTTLCGKDNVGVWIDFMRFERECGDRTLIQNIRSTALSSLKIELSKTFMDEQHSLELELWTALSKEVVVIDE